MLMDAQERILKRQKGMSRCPLHKDQTPSLSVGFSDDKVLLHCFSCQADVQDIVRELGLEMSDIFGERKHKDVQLANKYSRWIESDSRHQHDIELRSLTVALRDRDMKIIAIDRRVANKELTEDAALDLLAELYSGYTELENRWEKALIATFR